MKRKKLFRYPAQNKIRIKLMIQSSVSTAKPTHCLWRSSLGCRCCGPWSGRRYVLLLHPAPAVYARQIYVALWRDL